MSFGTNRYITHSRIGANSTYPTDSYDIKIIGAIATRHQNSRQRINQCTWLPRNMSCIVGHKIIYDLQCTIYNVRFTMYDLQCTIYDLRFTIYNVRFTIYNVRFTIYNIRLGFYTKRFAGMVLKDYSMRIIICQSTKLIIIQQHEASTNARKTRNII